MPPSPRAPATSNASTCTSNLRPNGAEVGSRLERGAGVPPCPRASAGRGGWASRDNRAAPRTQVFRGRQSSTWGPTTRIRVRRAAKPAPVTQPVIDATGVHWRESPRADRYLVKFSTAGSKRWKTRRTTSLQIYVAGVTRAKVKALNSAGASAYRTARR